MSRFPKKLTNVLQTGLTVLAIAAAAVLFVPRLMGWEVDTVLSGSMSPTYKVQSVVLVKPVSPGSVKVGDVITFSTGGATPTSHRVETIERRNGELSFVTKGDANEDADVEPVPASALHGKVVLGIPMLGRFVSVVRSPVGFTLLLILPGLLLMAALVKDMTSNRRRPAPVLEGSPS